MHASELHRLARSLREIALIATSNVDEERVTPGQLAVIEDVAAHPATTVGQIVDRTRLAQSLVSRVTSVMREAGVFEVSRDAADARRTVVSLRPATRDALRSRAGVPIDDAVSTVVPQLDGDRRAELIEHLRRALAILEEGRP